MRIGNQATMLTLKLIVIGVLGLALWVPTSIIGMLVHERAGRRDEVVREVSATWGQAQTVEGPVLSVPFNFWVEDLDGGRHRSTAWIHQLPDTLDIEGSLTPEVRYRSIYEVVLYRGELRLQGSFPAPNPALWGVDAEDVLWDQAIVTFGVTDPKGLRAVPRLVAGGEELDLEPGAGQGVFPSGLGAAVALDQARESTDGDPLAFAIDVQLAGSEGLSFLPVARETKVELESPWLDPSFQGAFLPLERSIGADGFSATWKVLALHREVPQFWRTTDGPTADYARVLHCASFGVHLLFPVDAYQRTMRSVKYSVLFSLLTFLGFFAVEVGGRASIHPVQYVVIGFALCLFYTLLLSLSELMSFDLAYLAASAVVVAMITAYIHGIVRRRMLTMLCAGVLAVVYGSLFVMLQLEELALLMGTALLLLLCGVVMLLTRRLTWNRAEPSPA